MNATQKLARYGLTFALALTMVATAGTTAAFADDSAAEQAAEIAEQQGYDPNSAPLVLETVNGGVQTAAQAAQFGVGTGAAVSGVDGLNIGVAGTEVGAAATGFGLGIPANVLQAQP